MDLRKERTRRSIVNAFMELRARKPLEKITVKELAELACINKATFYSHYHDIYDLSEQIENEVIRLIIKGVTHPDWFIIDSKQAVYELKELMIAHGTVLETLFSGNKERMMVKVERELKKEIFGQFPEYQGNTKWEIAISIMICGCFYAFLSHSADDPDEVTEIIGNLNQIMIKYLKEEERT